MFTLAILPAQFIKESRAAKIWCLIRSLDHPDNGGTGSGKVGLSLQIVARELHRSVRTAYRYIKAALAKGFFRSVVNVNGNLTIHYTSLKKVAKQLELGAIGPIAEFDLKDIDHVKHRVTEAATVGLQQASFFKRKSQEKSRAKGMKKAEELLATPRSARMAGAGVIARGDRLLYLDRSWLEFGVSQAGIASYLGCSERTIQRRLSCDERVRRGLEPVNKAQAAVLVAEGLSPAERKAYIKHAPEELGNRLVSLGRRIFRVGTNLYAPENASVRSQVARKAEYSAEQGIRPSDCFSPRDKGAAFAAYEKWWQENHPGVPYPYVRQADIPQIRIGISIRESDCLKNRRNVGASALDSLMNPSENEELRQAGAEQKTVREPTL